MIWPNAHEMTQDHTPARCIGLGPEDRDLLAGHIAQGDLPPGRLWVDCHLGPVPDFDLEANPELAALLPNYQRRIDLIIDSPRFVHVCELKPAASFVAFGQVLYYAQLLLTYLQPTQIILTAIITDAADPDLIPLCGLHDVAVYQLKGADYVPRGRPT